MGRARRPDQMASGIRRGAAARATDENANRTKARATRDARTTKAGANRNKQKRSKAETHGTCSIERAGGQGECGWDRKHRASGQMGGQEAGWAWAEHKQGSTRTALARNQFFDFRMLSPLTHFSSPTFWRPRWKIQHIVTAFESRSHT